MDERVTVLDPLSAIYKCRLPASLCIPPNFKRFFKNDSLKKFNFQYHYGTSLQVGNTSLSKEVSADRVWVVSAKEKSMFIFYRSGWLQRGSVRCRMKRLGRSANYLLLQLQENETIENFRWVNH